MLDGAVLRFHPVLFRRVPGRGSKVGSIRRLRGMPATTTARRCRLISPSRSKGFDAPPGCSAHRSGYGCRHYRCSGDSEARAQGAPQADQPGGRYPPLNKHSHADRTRPADEAWGGRCWPACGWSFGCRECGHPVEPDPAEMAAQYGGQATKGISYTIRVNCLKFYVCATVLWHHEWMSDEHSSTLCRTSPEYRELAGKLRELARACIFPGPRTSLLRLAVSSDHRAAHFDCQAAREGARWPAKRPNPRPGDQDPGGCPSHPLGRSSRRANTACDEVWPTSGVSRPANLLLVAGRSRRLPSVILIPASGDPQMW